ncbi:MAG TPA: bifunctional riboflavin kinase/FAD synthetase [Mycobacteriales bacterium]|nr:bifunctional riboflavin kinase/FAD synthetase [Mycobacteriales bacterium]
MKRWRGVEQIPGAWGRCVVTIGVFDGVHRGHQLIIARAVERARELGVPSAVITFDPHPMEVVRPGSHPPMLTDPRYKADLVEQLGVDAFLVLPFTVDFMRLTAAEFVHAVLVERLHASAVVVGENFRYGNGGAGTVAALTGDGRRFGFTAEPFPLQGTAEHTWSSTYVRSCVAAGDMASAAEALGREHRVHGIIVRGDQRGREIGFPTANLEPLPWSAVPADGIYAGHLVRGKELLPAAISIGTNPTFRGDERRVEAYVLDFDSDLYGEHVGLSFAQRLRDTIRFDTVDALVAQMHQDVALTRSLVGHPYG